MKLYDRQLDYSENRLLNNDPTALNQFDPIQLDDDEDEDEDEDNDDDDDKDGVKKKKKSKLAKMSKYLISCYGESMLTGYILKPIIVYVLLKTFTKCSNRSLHGIVTFRYRIVYDLVFILGLGLYDSDKNEDY